MSRHGFWLENPLNEIAQRQMDLRNGVVVDTPNNPSLFHLGERSLWMFPHSESEILAITNVLELEEGKRLILAITESKS
jgi:hypothetical protein